MLTFSFDFFIEHYNVQCISKFEIDKKFLFTLQVISFTPEIKDFLNASYLSPIYLVHCKTKLDKKKIFSQLEGGQEVCQISITIYSLGYSYLNHMLNQGKLHETAGNLLHKVSKKRLKKKHYFLLEFF